MALSERTLGSTHTTHTGASIWAPSLCKLTLGLTLVVVATAFEALAVATILPTTLDELGGLAFYGWTFSAFMLANIVGITVGGSESSRFGLSPLFIAGNVLFCGGLVVSGFAPAMLVIVLGRVLQGFGAGLLSTVAYASIARAYTVEQQPRMLATLSSAWVVPSLIGPGIAGVVAEHSSWRWVFLGLVPLPLIAAALALPGLHGLAKGEPTAPRTRQLWLALELGTGATMALTGFSLATWQLGLACVAIGGGITVHALQQLLPRGTLTARAGLPAAVASMALITFAFFGTEAFLPLALSRIRHEPVLLSGLALTSAALCWTAGAWVPVRLSNRFRRRGVIFSGLGILALGIFGILMLLAPAVPSLVAVLAWGIAGLGMGLAFTTITAAILESASTSDAEMASAALQLAQVLGAAIATGLGGAVVAARFAGDPPSFGIAIVDLIMLAAVALTLLTARGIPNASLQSDTDNRPT